MELPKIPVPVNEFISYIANCDTPIRDAVEPYRTWESRLREVYAQDRDNKALKDPNVNLVSLYNGHETKIRVRARNLEEESQEEKDKYLLPLSAEDRKPNGDPAITQSLQEFRNNFNVFSESSLVDMDWNNVVAAGSSAVTALLPVKAPHNESKRALRDYYHEKLAPASDVDLFLYGLTEQEAIEKIKQIERCIRDSILYETTVVRTKYAITIASQYPCRHVQIVLRIYKDISEILTGFDVDSACVAYNGSQVFATPRGIAAFMMQANIVDLSRRSPSYENRLSKYSHRGFEVYCPTLDRSRIDPTIFERSFGRVLGLARLLVLEKLPLPADRDNYLAKRREERGRPSLPYRARHRFGLYGNIKEQQPDEVAEWVEEDEVSNYHTFTVPYGPKFHAKKIEKLLFTKDLLLNAEWNKPKDREVDLHRHPAFFGRVEDVIEDCCEFCPEPTNEDEMLVAEKEAEIYIKGRIGFITDHPGRQQIGSFNPLTEDDWTEMAYVGNTARLCQAIVDGDLDHVKDWCDDKDADVNRRDHTGRTPLHLATLCSTPEIVQCLIDRGARLVARLVDGQTALHLAARRGNAEMVKSILEKSEENEAEEEEKQDRRRKKVRAEKKRDEDDSDSDADMDDGESQASRGSDEMTQGSFVRVKSMEQALPEVDNDNDDADVYNVNVVAWDYPTSPLHLAIMGGHIEVVKILIDTFGADVLLPIKIKDDYSRTPKAAIMTLVLASRFSPDSSATSKQLLSHGASSSQADMNESTALQWIVEDSNVKVFDILLKYDEPAAKRAINHLSVSGSQFQANVKTPLLAAIGNRYETMALKLLAHGASCVVTLESFTLAFQRKFERASKDPADMNTKFAKSAYQPLVLAIIRDMPKLADKLLLQGADSSTLNNMALQAVVRRTNNVRHPRIFMQDAKSVLELVRERMEKLKEALAATEPRKEPPKPEPLQSDEHYLSNLQPSSYSYWLAKGDLERAKLVAQAIKKEHLKESIKKEPKQTQGDAEKKSAMEIALKDFKNLEQRLLSLGAKTFSELHPDINLEETGWRAYHNDNSYEDEQNTLYSTEFKFMVPDIDELKSRAYTMLFEAAWTGDIEKVKQMTLAPWSWESGNVTKDSSATEMPPLEIAVQDQRGFSPYSLSVFRGHSKLASVIVEIATIQYRPKEHQPKYRYSVRPYNEDDEVENSDEDEDEVNVYTQLVDERYTVDNIASLGDTVESQVSPQTMIEWQCETWRCFGNIEEAKKAGIATPSREPSLSTDHRLSDSKRYSQTHLCQVLRQTRREELSSLFDYAVGRNDIAMFKFLLNTGNNLVRRRGEEESDISKIYHVHGDVFGHAARLGRTEILGELLESTGAELPLHRMAEQSGVEIDEKPKYYQGLTVYGRKRRDWADRGRGIFSRLAIENDTPPLLRAAFENNVESTEYFLGDAPLRRYDKFIEVHKNDKAIRALDEEAGGIKKVVVNWLDARRALVAHASVLAAPLKDDPTKQLRFILSAMPVALNGVNCARITPLHLAFQFNRYAAAKYLIEQGADQAARDTNSENILHHFVRSEQHRHNNGVAFDIFISLLHRTLPSDLLIQRSSSESGSYTPLALYMHLNSSFDVVDIERVKVMLKYSKGRDLEVMDGSGDYPLHYAVRQGWTRLVNLFIEQNRMLLYRENATGMTPVEIVDITVLRSRVDSRSRSIHPRLGNYDLPNMASSEFVSKKDDADADGLSNTWKAVTQAAETHPGKRKLVSLFDANEVAKRLAHAEKSKQRYNKGYQQYEVGSGKADLKDEINEWMRSANKFERHDLIKLWKEKGLKEPDVSDDK